VCVWGGGMCGVIHMFAHHLSGMNEAIVIVNTHNTHTHTLTHSLTHSLSLSHTHTHHDAYRCESSTGR
jgi:hypothetical protein